MPDGNDKRVGFEFDLALRTMKVKQVKKTLSLRSECVLVWSLSDETINERE